MIVRCFEGRSVPEVMERVRREMGEDAVILHTQQKRGFWWWLRRTATVRVWAAVSTTNNSQWDRERGTGEKRGNEETEKRGNGDAGSKSGDERRAPAAEPLPLPLASGASTTTEEAPLPAAVREAAPIAESTPKSRRKKDGTRNGKRGAERQSVSAPAASEAEATEAPRRRVRKRKSESDGEWTEVALRVERQLELLAASLWGQEGAVMRSGALGLLWQCGVDLATIPTLFTNQPPAPEGQEMVTWLRTVLRSHLPVTNGLSSTTKVAVLVGPTGVGKTTTVAKIAANQIMHRRRRVALVTVDVFRIGAVQQLETYARLMGLPFFVATMPEEAERCTRQALQVADLVLVDTIGRSPKHSEQLHALWELVVATNPEEVLLTLPANGNPSDLALAAEQFAIFCPTSLVITKLDETTQPGVIVNLVKKLNLPVSYITTGQNVPEDLEVPTSERLAEWVLSPLRERGLIIPPISDPSSPVSPAGEVSGNA